MPVKTYGAEGGAGKRPGLYGDGCGLYLQITAQHSKSWIFRFWIAERDPVAGDLVRDPATNKVRGRSREMGLGSSTAVSLAEARDRAAECRKLREQDIDPIEARETARPQAALERAKSLKFREAAATYMATHRVAWKNDKHAAQWMSTLETYAYPVLGDISMQADRNLRFRQPVVDLPIDSESVCAGEGFDLHGSSQKGSPGMVRRA
jgi:hypothetical protein